MAKQNLGVDVVDSSRFDAQPREMAVSLLGLQRVLRVKEFYKTLCKQVVNRGGDALKCSLIPDVVSSRCEQFVFRSHVSSVQQLLPQRVEKKGAPGQRKAEKIQQKLGRIVKMRKEWYTVFHFGWDHCTRNITQRQAWRHGTSGRRISMRVVKAMRRGCMQCDGLLTAVPNLRVCRVQIQADKRALASGSLHSTAPHSRLPIARSKHPRQRCVAGEDHKSDVAAGRLT